MEDLELFCFLIVVVGPVGELLIMRGFIVPESDRACKTIPKCTFGHQLLGFMHVLVVVQQVTRAIRWRFSLPFKILGLLLSRPLNNITCLELEEPMWGASCREW